MATQTNKLTVIAGPTAVGKGTVCAYLKEHYPQIWYSVSATTRSPRPGEIEGQHYFFVSQAQFETLIEQNEMLEWAKVHNQNYYGTPKAPVLEKLAAGVAVVLEIDLQGARQVKATMPDARFIFLAPPSFEELTRRLLGRGTESVAEQQKRLETAKIELAAQAEFDYVIVNDTVEKAAEKIAQILGVG